MKAGGKKEYYAVKKGRAPGIYKTWPECQAQVHGFTGALFKGFANLKDAQEFLGFAALPITSSSQGPPRPPGQPNTTSTAATTTTGKSPRDVKVSATNRYQPYQVPSQTGTAPGGSDHGNGSGAPEEGGNTGVSKRPDPQTVINLCLSHTDDMDEQIEVKILDEPHYYCVNFDGASRGNPGMAGAGACISEVASKTKVVGLACPLPYGCTNNEAEYSGLILGLQACTALGIRCPQVKGDSKLVVNQVNGVWRVNQPHLQPYHATAKRLLQGLYPNQQQPGKLQHVYREANAEADRLSNVAVDMQLKAG